MFLTPFNGFKVPCTACATILYDTLALTLATPGTAFTAPTTRLRMALSCEFAG